MLIPTVANRFNWFYAAGNTPATSLTRCIPVGQDAAVLALGCGDLRNILYTAYIDKGLPPRKLDVTCCDIDEKIIARNVLLLSLLLDNSEACNDELLWNIYYHLYVDEASVDVAVQQTQKLLATSTTLDDWNAGVYGRAIKFCDADTLADVRRTWTRIQEAAERCKSENGQKAMQRKLQPSQNVHDRFVGKDGTVITGLRSAAPLSLQSQGELPEVHAYYWKHGTVMVGSQAAKIPNPLLTGLLSELEILPYSTDPVLGFHIATAYAPLSEASPLKPEEIAEGFRAAAAAKTQFAEWISAFKTAFTKKIVVRFAVADVFAFCHTLQHASASGNTCANWYRRQQDPRPLTLDGSSYGRNGSAPKVFDMIDSSNLSDHVGALNILVATAPLLKKEPWATVYTELLIKREVSQTEALQNILCGHVPTVSLLLGVSPVQCLTDAKCESHVDEVFLGLMSRDKQTMKTQLHTRVAWKHDDQLSGQYRGRSKIHIEPKTLARIVFQIYLQMFQSEDASKVLDGSTRRSPAYAHFHRGTLASLLKMVSNRVQTDWPAMCCALLDTIVQDRGLMLATNQMQDFCGQMHILGVNTEPWILNEVKKNVPHVGSFHAWKDIPLVVAVTIVVPRKDIDKLYTEEIKKQGASPALVGSLKSSPGAVGQWHSIFGDVQICFGKVKTAEARDSDGHKVFIEEDESGWLGNSPLIASFYVPTAALQVEPKSALVGLGVPPTGQNGIIFGAILGVNMVAYETALGDDSRVFVTKFMPGQTAYPVVCGAVKPFEDMVNKGEDDRRTKLLVDVPASESAFSTITGHLDITSTKGKTLLKEKAPIELRQKSPFVIDVVFGEDKLICPLKFPIPIESVGSRTRIARTSGYIEVIAPLAKAGSSEKLSDFIFPSALSSASTPVSLNTPHLNLDNLPILDLDDKEGMRWLTTLTSLQFSTREKRLRTEVDEKTGMSENPRVNFKESLFTMFMVSSGIQGGQTGMFAINHPENGGIHMLIFVSSMRLDGDTASVVLDAAVIPFTARLIESGKMEPFLLLIRTLECCTLNVNDVELALWKKILPSLAERCRTWSHKSTCEYRRRNATIPISLRLGEQVLCSCGNGHLPDDFVSVPEWDTAKVNAVRIAISPTYAVPFVEEVVDLAEFDKAGGLSSPAERCRNCGKVEGNKGVALKKCTRCLKVRYCSVECQKKDWKKHRMECEEVE